ncbi:Glycosyl transferase, family 8 like protein [Aduncisulcus paluster]|uniref:Glycosyl transferase, family 8 like protein n=1 Tax=Aduncisulcus paluster TaxID=2918883 RepID=A0ABQ5K167_9EUKA|nr:Glycosyl transferase, family 8 like protein [Aduncisulcus paluster]
MEKPSYRDYDCDVTKCAYILLVLDGNPVYVGGAIVLAESLRFHGTKANIVVIAEKTIPKQWISVMEQFFDDVVLVDPVVGDVVKTGWKRFEHLYSSWLPRCFTKFRALELEQYEKICFLDSDMVAIAPTDEVFTYRVPAGVVTGDKGACPPGFAPPLGVLHSIQHRYGVSAACMLLKPSKSDFKRLLNCLDTHGAALFDPKLAATPTTSSSSHRYLDGIRRYNAGPDEVVISLLYALEWTALPWGFNIQGWLAGKVLGTEDGPARILHYVTDKPWAPKGSFDENKLWPDFKVWYDRAKPVYERSEEIVEKLSVDLVKDGFLPTLPREADFMTLDEFAEWEEKERIKKFKAHHSMPRRGGGGWRGEFVKELAILLKNSLCSTISESPLFKTLLTIDDGKYEPVHTVLNDVFTGLTLLDADKRMSVHKARVKVQCIKRFLPKIGEGYECPSIDSIIHEQHMKYDGSVGTIEGEPGLAGVEHEEGWDQSQ